MKCNNCGSIIPEDSDFCQYCGKAIFVDVPEQHIVSANERKKKRGIKPIFLIIALVLIIALAALNCVQYIYDKEQRNDYTQRANEELIKKNNEITELNKTISEKDKAEEKYQSKIKSLNETIEVYNNSIKEYQTALSYVNNKASLYNELTTECEKNLNYGYGADYFHVSKGILLLKKGGYKQDITLTTQFNGHVQVTSHVNGKSADLIWKENQWSGDTTTLTVISSKTTTGVTTVTFENDINNKTFELLIIVV